MHPVMHIIQRSWWNPLVSYEMNKAIAEFYMEYDFNYIQINNEKFEETSK